MHIAEAGAGPLVLLCHGFPESWYSWRHQLRALGDAGFHAVAPDMRGYGQTDSPNEVEAYDIFLAQCDERQARGSRILVGAHRFSSASISGGCWHHGSTMVHSWTERFKGKHDERPNRKIWKNSASATSGSLRGMAEGKPRHADNSPGAALAK
jgi:pimeloyl-ACP methyl ester carboxylesterase